VRGGLGLKERVRVRDTGRLKAELRTGAGGTWFERESVGGGGGWIKRKAAWTHADASRCLLADELVAVYLSDAHYRRTCLVAHQRHRLHHSTFRIAATAGRSHPA
jgi:hypothetical protein